MCLFISISGPRSATGDLKKLKVISIYVCAERSLGEVLQQVHEPFLFVKDSEAKIGICPSLVDGYSTWFTCWISFAPVFSLIYC